MPGGGRGHEGAKVPVAAAAANRNDDDGALTN